MRQFFHLLNEAKISNSNGADFTTKINADPAGFEAGVNRAIKSVERLHADLDRNFKSIGNMTANVTGAFAKMTAVFAGGGVLKHFIEDTNAWNSSAALMAKQLGISTERSSVLSVALKRIGVESETYTSAAEKLSKQIQGNAQAFDVLGVKVRDASGAYRPVTELMGEVNQKLAAIRNPIEQNIAGQQIYGKGWSEVRAILKLTSQSMAEAETRARELGLIVGPEGAAMSRQYTAQMRDLELVSKSLEMQVGNQLLPVFTNFGQVMSENVTPITQALAVTLQTVAVLGANVAFVFQGVGRDVGAMGAQIAAVFSGEGWVGRFNAISDAVKADAERAKAELVLFEQRVLGLGNASAAKRDCYVRRYSGLADAGCPEDFSSRLEIEA